MKKILIIIFTIAIFLTGGIFGYKKIVADEREKKIIQMFNKDILDNFVENKKSVIERLKTSNPEEADKIYNDYLKISQLIIENINTEHLDFLNNIYNEDSEYYFTERDWKTANKFLNNYDLEIFDLAETEVKIIEVPNYYYNIFKNYVTDDYKEYLKIWAKDDEELYQADAGLCITFEELGDRIARWENFLNKFPNSTLKSKVTALLNSYREDYILGMDNTPTIDGGYDNVPITIYEEAKKEYDRFMKKYPNSPTVELIKYFLKNYQNKNIHELIRCKIIEKFEKDPFVDVFSETLGKMIVIQGNYLKYILGEKDWNVNITDGYIYSGEEKYPIQILGTSILNSDETSTWVWAWKNSDIFNGDLLSLIYDVHGLGMDLKLCTFINSELKITDEVNGSILSTIACGILSENLAFDKIAYTEAGGVVFYAVKDLPNKVFSSSVDAGVFMDITLNCINLYNLNHKLFIESFLKQNKTKYKWQGDTIIAYFGKDGELKIDFEKVEDKLVLKEINFNEVK